jgi:hypothetical protein
MLFFVRGPPTGTHHTALFAAAFAHTHAAQRRVRQAALIERELEMRLRFPWRVVGAEAKIRVELVGLDQLAGIHLPVWIPCGLELAKRLHQFWAKHFWKQLGAGLSVAVLARERSAVTDDQIGSFFDELAELGDSLF